MATWDSSIFLRSHDKHRLLCPSFAIRWTRNFCKGESGRNSFKYSLNIFLNFWSFSSLYLFIDLLNYFYDFRKTVRYKKGEFSSVYRGSISHFCGQDPRCTWVSLVSYWFSTLFSPDWRKSFRFLEKWISCTVDLKKFWKWVKNRKKEYFKNIINNLKMFDHFSTSFEPQGFF